MRLFFLLVLFLSTNFSFSQGKEPIVRELKAKGYMFFYLDTLESDSHRIAFKGPRVKKVNLSIRSTTESREYVFHDFQRIYSILNAELESQKRMGYTEVTMEIDSMYIQDEVFFIIWDIKPKSKKSLSSIRLVNSKDFSEIRYLNHLLSKQDLSDITRVENYIKNAVGSIDYVKLGNSELLYDDSSYSITYNILPQKSNEVFATLGLLNNGYNTEDVQIIGEVKLSLRNIARKGIALDFNWEKKLIESQFLYSRIRYPLLFNTPIGGEVSFSLEKFDTSFLRMNYGLEAFISTDPFQRISVLYRKYTSRIDRFSTSELRKGNLPVYLDYNTNSYGISYKYEKKENQFFNHKGVSLFVNTMLGNKTIFRNSVIDSMKDNNGNSLSYLYDDLSLNVTNFSYATAAEFFFPIGSKVVVNPRLISEGIFSENVNQNEFFFIGGVSRPRGVDDKFINTRNYGIMSLDLQYYIDKNFYSNIFVDYTMYHNSISNSYEKPIGLGMGIKLRSNSSIIDFSLAYAIQKNTTVSFLDSKVHLKYTNVF